jgi:hypothetical protein
MIATSKVLPETNLELRKVVPLDRSNRLSLASAPAEDEAR